MQKRTFDPYELLERPARPALDKWEYGLDITPLHTVITFDKRYNAKLMQRVMRPAELVAKIKDEVKIYE